MPFEKYTVPFVLVLLLAGLPDFIFLVKSHIMPLGQVAMSMFAAYVITLAGSLLRKYKYLCGIYAVTVAIWLLMLFAVDCYCVFELEEVFSKKIVAIVLGTNPREALEFVQTNFSLQASLLTVAVITVFAIAAILQRYWVRRNVKLPRIVSVILLAVSLCGGGLNYIRGHVLDDVFEKTARFFQLQIPPELDEYFTRPEIVSDRNAMPENIVVIIGESSSRYHSSLYSYDKNTNPALSVLRDSSLLYIFNAVSSPETHTIESLTAVMSTYRPEYGDSVDWYRCTTVQEVMNKAEYKSFWISNQSKRGLYDNIITKYAELCDVNSFAGNIYSGIDRKSCDGILLDEVQPFLNDSAQNKLYFIHLMGSHMKFKMRYPAEFSKFKPEDYTAYPESQRQILSEYDNSLLYSDYVVSELIRLYEDKETLVVYFSDHALDIYQTDSGYFGFAKNNPESDRYGKSIPFMIYMSPKYKAKYPEVVQRIAANVNTEFRTDDFIYFIMDIAGIRFAGNDDVNKYTLLK